MGRLLAITRIAFGSWMLLNGFSHFAGPFLPEPQGSRELAIQLIDALRFSGLIHVTMGIQLLAGALLLSRLFMPLALAAVMPVNICALYWALVLERDAAWAISASLAVVAGALLMLAQMQHYRAMLARRALAAGESDANGGRYETLYANPAGQTPPRLFALALVPLAGAFAFFHFVVPSMLAYYCEVVLLYPACVLSLRLLQALLVNPEREATD